MRSYPSQSLFPTISARCLHISGTAQKEKSPLWKFCAKSDIFSEESFDIHTNLEIRRPPLLQAEYIFVL